MRRVLVLLLLCSPAAAVVDDNSAALVTDLVTAALAKEQGFEVLSSGDVRRQLELEANKQMLGCDANASSCLAEIAGAMGAQLVVYGKLGQLDDVVVLTLNLFDSTQGRAAGRVAMREPSLNALSAKVDGAVHELVAPFVARTGGAGATTKLLVATDPCETAGEDAAADVAVEFALHQRRHHLASMCDGGREGRAVMTNRAMQGDAFDVTRAVARRQRRAGLGAARQPAVAAR